MALTFPNIDPIAVSIGPLDLRWYALAYLSGILLGWFYALRFVKRDEPYGLRPNRNDIDDFLPWAVLGVILGGRVGYTLFYQFGHYMQNPLEILQVWNGGMSFHGGAAGVTIALIVYAMVKGFSPRRLADAVTCAVPIGLGLGRVANFVNGELYGRVSDVPWAFVFPGGGEEPRHPSQLYEAVLEGPVLFLVLFLLMRNDKIRRTYPGVVTGVFLIGYALARMFVELFREPDDYLGFFFGSFTMGQLLCIPMILVGASVIAYAIKYRASSHAGHAA
jgi:phosphatidylglycerol:prolipoprotein diacylglycerol transferase